MEREYCYGKSCILPDLETWAISAQLAVEGNSQAEEKRARHPFAAPFTLGGNLGYSVKLSH
jgi:hypothetical protein